MKDPGLAKALANFQAAVNEVYQPRPGIAPLLPPGQAEPSPAEQERQTRELQALGLPPGVIQERLERANGWNETQGPSQAIQDFRSFIARAHEKRFNMELDDEQLRLLDRSNNSFEFALYGTVKPAAVTKPAPDAT